MDGIAAQILREYKSVLDKLIEQELLLDVGNFTPFESKDLTVLSWSNTAHLAYLFGEYSSLQHYLILLQQRDFCFCFYDGSIVQIQYVISDNDVIKHRLCFFPCPFSFTPEDLEGIVLSELPILFDVAELQKRFKLVTPIRFDFDANFSDERHSHSHFSLNKASCRLPAYGPISLGHFFRFILRYFYEVEFAMLAEWDDCKPRVFSRMLPHPPPHEMHLETASGY